MHFHQRTRAIRKWLAVLILAAVSLLMPISAASAHDSLVGTSPADGETLDTVPEAIELTFTNPPIELGSEVSVESEDGTNWSDGPVEIVGNVATQPIKAGAPAGEYTVTWRVVSSDSHPIEGVYSFTAGGPGAGEAGDSSTAESNAGTSSTGSPPAVGPAGPLASPTSDAEQAQDVEEAATVFPTSFVAIMIGVLIILVIIIAVLARRRLGRTIEPDGPPDRT